MSSTFHEKLKQEKFEQSRNVSSSPSIKTVIYIPKLKFSQRYIVQTLKIVRTNNNSEKRDKEYPVTLYKL